MAWKLWFLLLYIGVSASRLIRSPHFIKDRKSIAFILESSEVFWRLSESVQLGKYIFSLQNQFYEIDIIFLRISRTNFTMKRALKQYHSLIFVSTGQEQVAFDKQDFHTNVLFISLTKDGAEFHCLEKYKRLQVSLIHFEHYIQSWLYLSQNTRSLLWENCHFTSAISKKTQVQLGKKFLSGHQLKVSSLPISPYVIFPPHPSAYDEYTGLVFDVLKMFSEHFNFTYTVQSPSDGNYGGISNGTWNGIIGQAMRNETELGVAALTVMYERAQVINYIWPMYEEKSSVLIPANEELRSLWAFMLPYQNTVWLCLVLALVLIALILWFLSNIVWVYHLSQGELKETLFGMHFLFTLGVVTNQAGVCTAATHSSRVLASAWCLAAVIFVYTYTSTLTSNLTVPISKPIIETLEELATGRILLPIVIRYSSYDLSMLAAKTGTFKDIGDLLRKYPQETRVTSNEEAIKRVLAGKQAYIIETAIIEDIITQDWKNSGHCRLAEARKSRDSLFVSYLGLVSPKGAIYNTALQTSMRQLHEHGFVVYFERRSHPMANPCLHKGNEHHARSLQLQHVESAFFLLGIGMLAATVAVLLEFANKHSTVDLWKAKSKASI